MTDVKETKVGDSFGNVVGKVEAIRIMTGVTMSEGADRKLRRTRGK